MIIVFFIVFLLFSTALMAAEQDTLRLSEHDFRLAEVEVVARQQRTILPPQRLEGAQLQALSTTSVADAVRYFSGVQLKDYGGVGGMKTVDVRSMGSHHLGVFYDGIEVGNAQNGTVDLGKFSMDNMEAIELYNGQKGDIFQPAKDFGNAGTLYLRTRRPHFAPDKPYNIEVRMRAGTFGLANPSVLYEQRLTERIHLSANAEYTYATGHYHFRYQRQYVDGTMAWDTTAVRQNGEIRAGRAELGISGYTDCSKWHVRGYYYNSSRGIPGAIVNNVWHNSQHQWDQNAFVQGNYTVDLPKGVSLQLNLKYANDKLRYLNPDTTLLYVDNTFLQQQVYASLATRYRIFPWWDVSVAADYELNWLRTNRPLIGRPIRHSLMVAAATAMSYKWIKGQISVLETYIHDKKDYNAITPMAMINIKPILHEEWYIRSFYKSAYRMPTFNDLYYQDNGVADLRPERTQQVDLGVEWTRTFSPLTLGLKADAYYNRVHDKIIAVPKGNSQYRWSMQNIGEVEIWGTELGLDMGFEFPKEHRLMAHVGYTFQQAQDITDPLDNDPYFGTYRSQIAYVPRHSCSATATYIWRGLNVAYAFVYVGNRYSSSANIRENYIQPWYTHDLSASYLWQLPKVGLQFGVEINNLFNQQYEVIPNYPMPGINGKGLLKLIF